MSDLQLLSSNYFQGFASSQGTADAQAITELKMTN